MTAKPWLHGRLQEATQIGKKHMWGRDVGPGWVDRLLSEDVGSGACIPPSLFFFRWYQSVFIENLCPAHGECFDIDEDFFFFFFLRCHRVLIATVIFLANSVCLGKLLVCSVLRGNKFLTFYYKSEFNSSWVVFLRNCCFCCCIAQCTHWNRTYSPTPFPASSPGLLVKFLTCNSTQCASMSFWKHREVVSCIRVKSLWFFLEFIGQH